MPKTPRLREWRDRAALSQEELHTRSGVSRATIADLEAGNRGAQPRTIRKLAEALNVEPDDLYGGTEHPLVEAARSQHPLPGFPREEEWPVRVLSERLASRLAARAKVLEEELKASVEGFPAGAVNEFIEEFIEEERALRALYEKIESPQPETREAIATIDKVYSRLEKLVAQEFDEQEPELRQSRERFALARRAASGSRDEQHRSRRYAS